MDKYEFNIKVEQIKKMVSRGDYETAMKIIAEGCLQSRLLLSRTSMGFSGEAAGSLE